MKILLLILFLSFSNMTYQVAQSIEPRISNLEKDVQALSIDFNSQLDSIKNQNNYTNTLIEGLTQKENTQADQIERLSGRENDRTVKLEMLSNMISQAGSSIENQLNTAGILLGIFSLLLGALGLALGIYINSKQKEVEDLLKRSDENLKKQENSEAKAEEFRLLVTEQVTSLYHKLQEEEYNDVVKKIEQDPNEIQNHLSRLMILNTPKTDFKRFENMLMAWFGDEDNHIYENVDNLLVFLIDKFPETIAANPRYSEIWRTRWDAIVRHIGLSKLSIFVDAFIKAFIEEKYPSINVDIARILEGVGRSYNPRYYAQIALFDKYPEKIDRFNILKMLTDHQVSEILLFYRPLIKQEYHGQQNTQEEQVILDAIPNP